MKVKFLIPLLFFGLVSSGQLKLPGEYILVNTSSNNIFDTTILKLNCDNTFFEKNKLLLVHGTWRVETSKKVILQIDSTVFTSKTSYKRSEIKLRISNDRLYWKALTKGESKKLVKDIERNTGEGQSNLKESYDNKNNYYRRVLTKDCQ